MRGGGADRSHFYNIISLENLFAAWSEFKKGKEKKFDVQQFVLNLEDNLFELHDRLSDDRYQHSRYASFFIQDPKLRHIHKASVVDRILHHALMKKLEPIFEKTFIFDSYSSRKNKGTHKAIRRFRSFAWNLSRNNTKNVWILKCDIRRFFDSIDHVILEKLISKKIKDEKTIQLLHHIIESFEVKNGKGMPLGNVTSQLFSNIYMNPFDQFVKRELKIGYYIRYADDFVILSCDKIYLENLIPKIRSFLEINLELDLHPKKISIQKWKQGVDFLGYIIFPYHSILRTKTKRRMFRKIGKKLYEFKKGVIDSYAFNQSVQSYFGILKHCRGKKIEEKIKKILYP